MKMKLQLLYILVLWQVVNGHQFKVSKHVKKFNDAVDFCNKKDMVLVRITSQAQNDIVIDYAKKKNAGSFWINATEPLTYVNWAPSNSLDGESHCAVILENSNGLWNNSDCKAKYHALCAPTDGIKIAKTYEFPEANYTWPNGMLYCLAIRMQLVKIFDKHTNVKVNQLAKQHGYDSYWINFSDKDEQLKFETSDGDAMQYNNWARGQPDATAMYLQCIRVSGDRAVWYSDKCTNQMKIICESK